MGVAGGRNEAPSLSMALEMPMLSRAVELSCTRGILPPSRDAWVHNYIISGVRGMRGYSACAVFNPGKVGSTSQQSSAWYQIIAKGSTSMEVVIKMSFYLLFTERTL